MEHKIKPISESKEQIALVKWAKLNGFLLAKITNEGKRSIVGGRLMVSQGLEAGFPDLFIAEARGGFFGCFLEVKQNRVYSDREMASDHWKRQEKWLIKLTEKNYFVRRAFGWIQGREILMGYRKCPTTEPLTF